jgi:hypothetical protein
VPPKGGRGTYVDGKKQHIRRGEFSGNPVTNTIASKSYNRLGPKIEKEAQQKYDSTLRHKLNDRDWNAYKQGKPLSREGEQILQRAIETEVTSIRRGRERLRGELRSGDIFADEFNIGGVYRPDDSNWDPTGAGIGVRLDKAIYDLSHAISSQEAERKRNIENEYGDIEKQHKVDQEEKAHSMNIPKDRLELYNQDKERFRDWTFGHEFGKEVYGKEWKNMTARQQLDARMKVGDELRKIDQTLAKRRTDAFLRPENRRPTRAEVARGERTSPEEAFYQDLGPSAHAEYRRKIEKDEQENQAKIKKDEQRKIENERRENLSFDDRREEDIEAEVNRLDVQQKRELLPIGDLSPEQRKRHDELMKARNSALENGNAFVAAQLINQIEELRRSQFNSNEAKQLETLIRTRDEAIATGNAKVAAEAARDIEILRKGKTLNPDQLRKVAETIIPTEAQQREQDIRLQARQHKSDIANEVVPSDWVSSYDAKNQGTIISWKRAKGREWRRQREEEIQQYWKDNPTNDPKKLRAREEYWSRITLGSSRNGPSKYREEELKLRMEDDEIRARSEEDRTWHSIMDPIVKRKAKEVNDIAGKYKNWRHFDTAPEKEKRKMIRQQEKFERLYHQPGGPPTGADFQNTPPQ